MTSQDLRSGVSGEEKFTQGEMVALFGEEMPLEAAELVFGPKGDGMTIGDVRARVREIARKRAYAERLAAAFYRETIDVRVEPDWTDCHVTYRSQQTAAMSRALEAVCATDISQVPGMSPKTSTKP